MKISRNLMKSDEKATFELRNLYQKYGYRQFKMGKFEEYDLYVRNKDFIQADSIITFSDNGKLMALKPDLTLSIIKNYHYTPGAVEKVYYSENIYRVSKSAYSYKEILQTGLECMGDIDLYHICEVTALAAKSLAAISGNYVLEISHMGLIKGLLSGLTDEIREQIVKCVGQKNLHEIRKICQAHHIEDEIYKSIELLVTTYGSYRKVLAVLKKAGFTGEAKEALCELETIWQHLSSQQAGKEPEYRLFYRQRYDLLQRYFVQRFCQRYSNQHPVRRSVRPADEKDGKKRRRHWLCRISGFSGPSRCQRTRL